MKKILIVMMLTISLSSCLSEPVEVSQAIKPAKSDIQWVVQTTVEIVKTEEILWEEWLSENKTTKHYLVDEKWWRYICVDNQAGDDKFNGWICFWDSDDLYWTFNWLNKIIWLKDFSRLD